MRLLALLVSLLVSLAATAVPAPPDARSGQAALRASYDQLRDRLARNPFGQPLHIEAREEDKTLRGDAYAVLSQPFPEASRALADASQWCEILLLPFNTKHCEAGKGESGPLALTIMVGRKYSTPLERTHRLEFRFEVASRSDDYLQVTLTAPEGPFSTRDYRIVFELAPLDGQRSFMHMSYAYGYGSVARAAMRAYLATIGAHKVGFTVEGRDDAGNPALVRGMRGVMERNTMRYYLAIEAYLRALRAPQQGRVARMIEEWFASVERYPRQLHELDHDEYIEMKRREFHRMHAATRPQAEAARVSPAPRTASSSP